MFNRLVRSLAPALVLALLPVASFAGVSVGVSINIAPPPLPVYVQPPPPADDYIWTPGYWAYGDDGYYWVPGTWVLAPQPGFLWTPGYWGWENGAYLFHGGYWGPHVGFYGGVNYGFGYGGVGFEGGYWRGGHVIYNRSVTNVTNINVTNVYNKTVVVHNVNRVSFNGGHGGISARPNPSQLAAEHDRHIEATADQRQHLQMAAGNRDLRASVNNGRPHIAATERPGAFSGRGVVAARAAGGPGHAGGDRPGGRGPGGNDRPEGAHPGRPGGPALNGGGERNDRPPQAQHETAHNDAIHAGPANRPSIHADRPNPGAHPGGSNEPRNAPHAAGGPGGHSQGGGQPGGRPQVEHRGPSPSGPSGPGGGAAHEQGPRPGGGGGHEQGPRPAGGGGGRPEGHGGGEHSAEQHH